MRLEADYVVVGAGLTGATIARMLHDAGCDVLLLEARDCVGGNVVDAVHPCGIRQNLHGPHYFRTSSERIRDYALRFAEFYPFAATLMTQVADEVFAWPLHRAIFDRFAQDHVPPHAAAAANFETAMLALVPPAIYELFIRGYSQKQWGVDPATLDADLAKRIEVRDDGDLRLSKASFQGLPGGGFTGWVQSMLRGIETRLSTDFHDVRDAVRWRRKLIYTGPVDRFFDHCFGKLPYRAQHRVDLFIPGTRSVYPCGQTNLPAVHEGGHVRTVEWRHMLAPGEGPETGTLLTLEFPVDAADWRQAEYPLPTRAAREHYDCYAARTAEHPDVLFCGRLGEYRYLDMDQAIGRAMLHADRLLAEHAT